jgi:hypothetical protein
MSNSFLTPEPNSGEFEGLMRALLSFQDVGLFKQLADFLKENRTYYYSVVDCFCSHASISIRDSEFRTAMSLTCLDLSSRLLPMLTTIHMEISSIIALDSVQKKLKRLNFEAIILECLKNDAFLSQLRTHFFAIQKEQMHYQEQIRMQQQEQQEQQEQQQQELQEQQRLEKFRLDKKNKWVLFHGSIPKKSDGPFIIPAADAVKPEPND